MDTLPEPKPKRRCHKRFLSQPSLPVPIETITGIPSTNQIWKSFNGRFNGFNVVIDHPEDIHTIYEMGFFGKGNMSKSGPRIKQKPELVSQRQYKRRLELKESYCSNGETSNTSTTDDTEELLVVNDTDDEVEFQTTEEFYSCMDPKVLPNPYSMKETLHLTLEEACFLSFGLGCLLITDEKGSILNLEEMWLRFRTCQDDFVEQYVVYHYYRSQNWIVKQGLKFGADFLLYKDGPPMYHATYLVKISTVESASLNWADSSDKLTWAGLMGINRTSQNSGKNLLLCYVVKPPHISNKELASPYCVSQYQIREVLVKRIVTSEEREALDNKDFI